MTTPWSAEVERFRALIEQRFGLAFDDTKLVLLTDILDQRVRSLGCRGAAEYLRQLESTRSSDELGPLGERLTVCETYFFRDRDQFRVLREVVLPEVLARRGTLRRVRVLSAGCASGAEPYSIGITVRESVADLDRWNIEIEGFDLSPAALQTARTGRYSRWSLREMPAELRERYFRREGTKHYRLDESIRGMVRFEQYNLAEEEPAPWGTGEFDIVFCRNVLMYFSPRAAQIMVHRLVSSLAPGGYAFLGTAETLRGLSQAFHLRRSHGTFYYQLAPREPSAVGAGSAGASTSREDGPTPPAPAAAMGGGDSWMHIIERASRRIDELARDRGAAPTASSFPRQDGASGTAAISRARHLILQERFADALELLTPAPVDGAQDEDALILRAIVLTNQGQCRRAEELCREVLARDELNAGAHYLMALCREQAGDPAGAADHDQYALYVDPSFAMPRLHLGLMARRGGNVEVARRELGHAMMLLAREDAIRIVLLSGGFTREGLLALCRAELCACGGQV